MQNNNESTYILPCWSLYAEEQSDGKPSLHLSRHSISDLVYCDLVISELLADTHEAVLLTFLPHVANSVTDEISCKDVQRKAQLLYIYANRLIQHSEAKSQSYSFTFWIFSSKIKHFEDHPQYVFATSTNYHKVYKNRHKFIGKVHYISTQLWNNPKTWVAGKIN